MTSTGLTSENSAESRQKFIEEILKTLRYDLTYSLGLQCLPQVLALNSSSLNPEDLAAKQIVANELALVEYFMKVGPSYLSKILKEIVDVPSSRVIDFLMLEMADLTCSFLLLTQDQKSEQMASQGTLNAQLMENLPSSRQWVIDAISAIPINIFTNDEKERMVRQLDKCAL